MPQSKGWMEEMDDAAVARARAGDSDGFRLLVERHSRNVFRLAYRMIGNEQDAEDIVQETFLRAYRQLNRYESRSTFGTWLYRIAANCSLDLLRARKRSPEAPTAAGDRDVLDSMPAGAPGPDRVALSAEVQRRVAAAMGELSQQERTAFVLRHFEGLSIDDISGMLGVGGNAAKHSIFRAVQKLRKALEPVVSV
jgi:RNA polymerase sigma-70 factor (ECF subfamily)